MYSFCPNSLNYIHVHWQYIVWIDQNITLKIFLHNSAYITCSLKPLFQSTQLHCGHTSPAIWVSSLIPVLRYFLIIFNFFIKSKINALKYLGSGWFLFIKLTFYLQPLGKAVFVRISDEYAANILRTALFILIVRYIFTSCREYLA